jgi:hypothetical protein
MITDPYTVEQYFLSDYPRTLFPLTTTALLIERFSTEVKDFVYNKLLSAAATLPGFPIQQRCYAAKRGYSLRRTVKLDPAAEFFIYDVVFRNRKTFRPDHRSSRRSFGYRFAHGRPEPVTDSYKNFKSAIASARHKHPLTLRADVATYFNNIYHHDLVNAMRSVGWPDADVDALGRFLRESNAGRSVDCVPHGIHPCKVLGSEFLRFVDNSFRLKSQIGLRFLDDIHLFDSDEGILIADLVALQELLGEKNLSLNESKTAVGRVDEVDLPQQVDEIKRSLLQIRRHAVEISGEAIQLEYIVQVPPTSEQVDYLLALLENPDIDESDAELVLVLLRRYTSQVVPKLSDWLTKYPGLTKAVYHYARLAPDRSGLAEVLLALLRGSSHMTEYQLFWLTKLAEDFLSTSKSFGDILTLLLDHPRATTVSKAKVLEIADRRWGLPDLREEVLRSGRSDWEAWAAAAGTRSEPAAGRNHLLAYFAKGSPLNSLIAACIRLIP